MGLNPGIPAASILSPTSTTDRESASFIVNGAFRHVVRVSYYCPNLGPSQTSPYMSIVNGFNSGGGANEFNFDGTVSYNGELFIKHDGCLIVGALMYEDYLTRHEQQSGTKWAVQDPRMNAGFEAVTNQSNRTITVRFRIPASMTVTSSHMSIYNARGTMVAELIHRTVGPGIYEAVWNTHGIPSGIYVARVKVNGAACSKKIVFSSKR